MSSHRIRLPAPWQVRCLPSDSCVSRVFFQRSFQRPSGLDDDSRVSLELELLEPLDVSVVLNGQPCRVERRDALHVEVPLDTRQLQSSNQIEIAIDVRSLSDRGVALPPPSDVRPGHHYLNSVALRVE